MIPPQVDGKRRSRALDPIDRFSEILFGVIMAMTFTGSISAAESGHEEVRTMLFAALGCNIAWGIVDAVMYLLTSMSERGRAALALNGVRGAADPAVARRIIADALPPVVASAMGETELESVRQRLTASPAVAVDARLGREDFQGALVVFVLVALSTFPLVLPFIFMNDAMLALRVSNGIAIGLLFVGGYRLGRHIGRGPWKLGLSMVLIGALLVGITIALGG